KEAPPSTRPLSRIVDFIQRNNTGIRDWSLGDLTVGLYLIYLLQTSSEEVEHVKGVQIVSDSIIQDLIYHTELAKGDYKELVAGLTRNSMLWEKNILKFAKNSSVWRPGYYIGQIPITNLSNLSFLESVGLKQSMTLPLILFLKHPFWSLFHLVSREGISTISWLSDVSEYTWRDYNPNHGLKNLNDLSFEALVRYPRLKRLGILVSSNDREITLKGFSTYFSTTEAAHWFLHHEMGTIRKFSEKREGFRLRFMGHLEVALLLTIMLRKKSQEELGFSPEIVYAVRFRIPPCVSKELTESCSSLVSTFVMQDDIIPRLSAASL
ncbi:hypothetical protein GIB67_017715, partial [Kingdonia uniflora]